MLSECDSFLDGTATLGERSMVISLSSECDSFLDGTATNAIIPLTSEPLSQSVIHF